MEKYLLANDTWNRSVGWDGKNSPFLLLPFSSLRIHLIFMVEMMGKAICSRAGVSNPFWERDEGSVPLEDETSGFWAFICPKEKQIYCWQTLLTEPPSFKACSFNPLLLTATILHCAGLLLSWMLADKTETSSPGESTPNTDNADNDLLS